MNTNKTQTEQLTQVAVICRLFDKMSNEWINYTGANYTKINGVYGYLSIDVMSVKFFWYCEDSQSIYFDDITDRFTIEYVFTNGI